MELDFKPGLTPFKAGLPNLSLNETLLEQTSLRGLVLKHRGTGRKQELCCLTLPPGFHLNRS